MSRQRRRSRSPIYWLIWWLNWRLASCGLARRELLLALDLALQGHEAVEHAFRAGRAAGNVDVDRNDEVDPGERRVVVVEAPDGRAGAEGHPPLGRRHLVVRASQDGGVLDRRRADLLEKLPLTGGEW